MVPGRAFVRRLIDLTIGVKKPFHYVTLNAEARADLNTWQEFLISHNGKSFFLPTSELSSQSLNLYTDASSLACAAVFGRFWFSIPFPQSWKTKNIAFLELFPIFVALNVFGSQLKNSRVCFHTDNEAISIILNKQTSRDREIMQLVRPFVLFCMNYNIRFRSQHIPGKLNVLPDRLSRSLQVSHAFLEAHGMSREPTHIPKQFLPQNWQLQCST